MTHSDLTFLNTKVKPYMLPLKCIQAASYVEKTSVIDKDVKFFTEDKGMNVLSGL